MKHSHSILFALAMLVCACMMTSCIDDYAKSSPEIQFGLRMFVTTPEGVRDTIGIADTLNIGDTLRWNLVLYGGFNFLTSFQAQCDPAAFDLQLEVDSVVATILAPGSDLEKGKMVFPSDRDIIMCTTTVRFVPKKSGNQPIYLTVANNANDEKYSPRTYTYTAVIR